MNQIRSADSHALLTCFFEECESQFRFLEEEHGYLYFSGLMEYKGNYKLIKPYNEEIENPEKPFYAVTRYERNNQAIEVFYGDQNYILEIFVYPDAIQRFSIRDLISAARGDMTRNKAATYLTEARNIADSLKWFSNAMRDNPKVLQPSERLVERASVMRDTLLEQGVRSHLDKLIKNASQRAAEAFAKKDFSQVIDILTPFEDYLSSADNKKLRIAREKTS